MRRVLVVYALVLDEDLTSVLMVQNRRENGPMDWTLPGGAVEPGESLTEALVREVEEEAGITVVPGDVVAVNEARLSDLDEHAVFITFRAASAGGTPRASMPDEITAVDWVPLDAAGIWLRRGHPDGIADLLTMQCPYRDEGTVR